MPFSAKRSAYRPSPSFSSHSAIGCIAALDRLSPISILGAGKEAQSYHFWRRAGRAKLHRTRRRSRRRPGAEVFVTAPISMTAARLSGLVLPYFYVNDTIDGSRRRGRAPLRRVLAGRQRVTELLLLRGVCDAALLVAAQPGVRTCRLTAASAWSDEFRLANRPLEAAMRRRSLTLAVAVTAIT